MPASADDPRRMGQERYLPVGTAFVRRRYSARVSTSDHDHCEFCSAKFMADDSPDANVLTEGYATTAGHPHGADYHWVCEACLDDFAEEFEWRVTDS